MLGRIIRLIGSILRERKKRKERDPHWHTVEKRHKRTNPFCAACGGEFTIQVHHIQPFHLKPEMELEPTNLISLCMGKYECHLKVGHGGSWKAYNPTVVRDAGRALRGVSAGVVIVMTDVIRLAHEGRKYQ